MDTILNELSKYVHLLKNGVLSEETFTEIITLALNGEIDLPESIKLQIIEAFDQTEHTNFKAKSQITNIPPGIPVVFISYSWDSEEHRQWVRQLADDLQTKYGIHVLCDCYNRKGEELTNFMVNAIEKADRVLVIGTPNYRQRSKMNCGGAGFEGHIINVDIYHHWDSCKYIPILRNGKFDESFPITIEARTGMDFTDDMGYEENLRTLANDIKGKPENARPELNSK